MWGVQQDDGHPPAIKRAPPQNATKMAPWSWTSSLQAVRNRCLWLKPLSLWCLVLRFQLTETRSVHLFPFSLCCAMMNIDAVKFMGMHLSSIYAFQISCRLSKWLLRTGIIGSWSTGNFKVLDYAKLISKVPVPVCTPSRGVWEFYFPHFLDSTGYWYILVFPNQAVVKGCTCNVVVLTYISLMTRKVEHLFIGLLVIPSLSFVASVVTVLLVFLKPSPFYPCLRSSATS